MNILLDINCMMVMLASIITKLDWNPSEHFKEAEPSLL